MNVKTWLYVDQALEEADVKASIASIEGLVDGWILTQGQASFLDSDAESVYIASSAEELDEMVRRSVSVFVPVQLAESISLIDERLPSFKAQLWLEDSYISRFQIANRPEKNDGGTPAFGFAGTNPEFALTLPSGCYAYICKEGMNAASVSTAVQLGVRDFWLSGLPSSDIRIQCRKLSDAVEAIELSNLFAGMSPAELENVWEQRLCLVARRALPAGYLLSEDDLSFAPSSGGISADMVDKVLGKRLRHALSPQETLTFGILE